MSHFTVLVIGNDPEKQLKPFEENGTNEKQKWDWYQLGGRWHGFFKLKPNASGTLGEPSLLVDDPTPENGTADCARKDAIDWETMRGEAEMSARMRYARFRTALGNHPMSPTWDSFRAQFPADVDGGRNALDAYFKLPGIKALQAGGLLQPFGPTPEDFDCSADEFAAKVRNRACSTRAVIKDGEWYELGSMGWWGIVTDGKDGDEWAAKVWELIGSLPDDTLLSVYDCHI